MTQQLDKIHAEIQLRVGELHQMKENMKSMANSKDIYQTIEQRLVENMSQMEELVLKYDVSRRDNEKLESTNMDLETAVRKMQGDIIAINEDKMELTQLVQEKSGEVSRLNLKMDSLASIVSEHRVFQQQNQEYHKAL